MAAAARFQRAQNHFQRFLNAVKKLKVDDGTTVTLKKAIQKLLVDGGSTSNPNGFPGMQPASLDANNMYDIVRKRDDYFVCEKTDGERFLLLLYAGECYLIDRRFNFFRIPRKKSKKRASSSAASDGGPVAIGAPVPKKFINNFERLTELNPVVEPRVTLLDGELTAEATDPPSLTYYIFDSIIINGRSVQDLTLSDRLKLALNCIVFPQHNPHLAAKGEGSFRIMMKEMFRVNVPGTTEHLLNHVVGLLQHENDGLIFTPNTMKYRAGTTYEILKWKPKHLNSIDFMLQLCYRGNDPEGRFTINMLAENSRNVKRFIDWIDVPTEFRGRLRANMIVECTFDETGTVRRYESPDPNDPSSMSRTRLTWDDPEEQKLPLTKRISDVAYELYKGEGCWRIHRLREDKATPNHTHIMKRIFKSIKDAVDKDALIDCINGSALHPPPKENASGGASAKPSGAADHPLVKRLRLDYGDGSSSGGVGDGTSYWETKEKEEQVDRTKARNKSKSVGMKNFHNRVVKDSLYRKYVAPDTTVVELAGGQGGDLFRLLDRGPGSIILVDLYAAALDEAASRWTESAVSKWAKTRNGGKAGRSLPSLAVLAADLRKPLPMKSLEPAGGKPLSIDTVSCQFALHYFFESPASACNMLRGIYQLVRPGGTLMATLYSGHAVLDLLRAQPAKPGNPGEPVVLERRWMVGGELQSGIEMQANMLLPNFDPSSPANRDALAALAKDIREAVNSTDDVKVSDAAAQQLLEQYCGKKIEVIVDTIGTKHPEFLVDLEFLHGVLEALGFQKLEDHSFSNFYDEGTLDERSRMPEEMKSFSFLYHACAWRRTA
eukprot:INCI1206.1.p1 GENE.INCI1206.1~~INCI1206.1.p1  ORF type:complete len:833 (+),score=170.98 INCI1206.1:246-2744(+)